VSKLRNSNFPQKALIDYIYLNRFTGSKNNKVIIVFDGYMPAGLKRQEAGFEVLFGGDVSADELIKSKVSGIKQKSEVIVVSDDRQIKDFITAKGARSFGISDFMKKKTKQKTNEAEKDIDYSLQYEITQELRKSLLKKYEGE